MLEILFCDFEIDEYNIEQLVNKYNRIETVVVIKFVLYIRIKWYTLFVKFDFVWLYFTPVEVEK